MRWTRRWRRVRPTRPGRPGCRSGGAIAAIVAILLTLAACAGGPPRAGSPTPISGPAGDPARPERDGPEPIPPPGLALVPDAEPIIEAIRSGGPNLPYNIGGEVYVPIVQDLPFAQRGLASWYGRKFHGARTASGERYDMYAMTAAHPTLPIPSYARVRNPANGREVTVRINDRGPFHSARIIDLSYTAALKLDLLRGVAPVDVRRITAAEIRAMATPRRDEVVGSASDDKANPPAPDPIERFAAFAASIPLAAPAVATVATAPRPPAACPDAASGYWVQFGAFRAREGATALQQRLGDEQSWLAPLLVVFHDAPFFRLQAGPYAERAEAQRAAERAGGRMRANPNDRSAPGCPQSLLK